MEHDPARTWRAAIIDVLLNAGEPLHYREIAARILRSGVPTVGETPHKTVSRELSTHPQLFEKTTDGTYALAGWERVDTPGSEEESRSIASQGYRPNAAIRRLIERHAMQQASAYFRAREWDVTDVSATQPYDIRCTRSGGAELSVEVKGTATAGQKVIVTKNEVAHARAHYPHTALYILANVLIGEEHGVLVARAGTARLFNPWNVDNGQLEPLTYAHFPLA